MARKYITHKFSSQRLTFQNSMLIKVLLPNQINKNIRTRYNIKPKISGHELRLKDKLKVEKINNVR